MTDNAMPGAKLLDDHPGLYVAAFAFGLVSLVEWLRLFGSIAGAVSTTTAPVSWRTEVVPPGPSVRRPSVAVDPSVAGSLGHGKHEQRISYGADGSTTSPRPECEAVGCSGLADWAYIGEGGDLYLCVFHGGTEPVDGWTWINGSLRPCEGCGRRPTEHALCGECVNAESQPSAATVAVAALAADLGVPLGEVLGAATAKVEANAERHAEKLAAGATGRLSVDLPLAAYDRLHVFAASEGVSLSALAAGVLTDAVARADERGAAA